jgi:acyl carrier protein
MNNVTIQKEIYNYIINNSHVNPDILKPNLHIFNEGILNSLGLALLIDFIVNKFNLEINEEDITEKNFSSINAITIFIERKLHKDI